MQKLVRVHFYLGPICRSEVIDHSKPFHENRSIVLSLFGISPETQENYTLKLIDGGLVERNEVLFHDDRVMILPKEGVLEAAVKDEAQHETKEELGNKALLENINNLHLKDFH